MAQARKPPVPQAGVEEALAEAGLTMSTANWVRVGGVVLACVAGALEVFEDLLVEVAEEVAAFGVDQRDVGLDLVDDLAEQMRRTSCIGSVDEDASDDAAVGDGGQRCRSVVAGDGCAELEAFEGGEEGVVDEGEEAVAGGASGRRPRRSSGGRRGGVGRSVAPGDVDEGET
ncbi:MAG: hypothetical protein R3F39_25125 [Myxococcota bacterium]